MVANWHGRAAIILCEYGMRRADVNWENCPGIRTRSVVLRISPDGKKLASSR